MIYVKPLSEYQFTLTDKKLQGLSRLSHLKLPTVPLPFIIAPDLFKDFIKTRNIPEKAQQELKKHFNSIRQQKNTLTLRNSIFESKNPGLSYSVVNTLNIKSFEVFLKSIKKGYQKVIRQAINPDKVEFCYLFYAFYSSEKCGSLLSNNGQDQIYIQAILGQTTKLLLRGDIDPDEYLVKKKTYKLINKSIATKKFRVKKTASGTTKVRVKKSDQQLPVITDDQVIKIAKFSQILEKTYGPQEIEWAVLDSGQVIFQETRNFTQAKQLKFLGQAEIIYPKLVKGEVINLTKITPNLSLADKIVITQNLNINLINQLAFLHRPKAVILTKGSLTSHAATVLREAKITTLLAKNLKFSDYQKIQINKDGTITKII